MSIEKLRFRNFFVSFEDLPEATNESTLEIFTGFSKQLVSVKAKDDTSCLSAILDKNLLFSAIDADDIGSFKRLFLETPFVYLTNEIIVNSENLINNLLTQNQSMQAIGLPSRKVEIEMLVRFLISSSPVGLGCSLMKKFYTNIHVVVIRQGKLQFLPIY
jgi:hypothetical protein